MEVEAEAVKNVEAETVEISIKAEVIKRYRHPPNIRCSGENLTTPMALT